MSYCKYHPSQAATHSCEGCETSICNSCVNEGDEGTRPTCLLWGHGVESLGVTADAVPFWRRLDKAFRYPLSAQVLVMIGVVSLATALSVFLPWYLMVGVALICTGVMTKYCFNCLSETALGEMAAPDISGAYQGGVILVFRLFLACVLLFVAVGSVGGFVSPGLAGLLAFLIVIGLPAMIVVYAMTENIFEALNPVKLVALVTKIGLPYGLILAILMIMMASVGSLSQLIGQQSVITLALQSVVSNYYAVVMFHLMGYMIFQYQHCLGYTAESSQQALQGQRADNDKVLARIKLLIKEGYWSVAEKEFAQALKRYSNDEQLNTNFFLFTLSKKTGDAKKERLRCEKIADGYLAYLLRTDQKDRLYHNYNRARLALPDYRPQAPELRYELAILCYDIGNPRASVSLLNGLHKTHPDYPRLTTAYELLAEALDDIPNMAIKAQECRQLIAALEKRSQQREAAAPKKTRVRTTAVASELV